MKGWTPDGREVVLLPWQEEAVRQILDAQESGTRLVICRPRAGGKSTVSATVARLLRAEASPAPDA